jgi:hypothetical protein
MKGQCETEENPTHLNPLVRGLTSTLLKPHTDRLVSLPEAAY